MVFSITVNSIVIIIISNYLFISCSFGMNKIHLSKPKISTLKLQLTTDKLYFTNTDIGLQLETLYSKRSMPVLNISKYFK